MAYHALSFDADAATAEAWADALLAAGALSVDVSDPGAGSAAEIPLYAEPGEPTAGVWALNRLTALFAPEAEPIGILSEIAADLGLALPPAEIHEVAEQDWVRATQAQFAPIRVAPRLWIVPSWCTSPDPAAVNLTLDPGLAFGTGSHPTTRLCLAWLAAHLQPGESVLDYGCGSGILAIAAALLGAGEVAGVDVDPQAIAASRANAARNAVAAAFALPGAPEDSSATRRFDVVCANILANPLRVLAPLLAARTRPGGRIVLSGVLAGQANDVAGAYARWFKMQVWADEDGWVALAGHRSAASGTAA